MEALVAASVAALTIYDMTKALDKRIEIQDVWLLEKTGGKAGISGVDRRRGSYDQRQRPCGHSRDVRQPVARLRECGSDVVTTLVIPDEQSEITDTLRDLADRCVAGAIFTTGGTGINTPATSRPKPPAQ